MNNFEEAAYEAFLEAAKDKYDFTTCQRPDGSKYGSSGRCIKGSETSPASKDDKKKSSKKSGGGGGGKQETQREKNIRIANEEEARLKKLYGNKGNSMDRLTSADVMKAVGTHD